MANSKAKQKKLTKADREHIDNQVVLATAIGLISAIFLLYLYRWLNSSLVMGTRIFLSILIWAADAVIVAALVMIIWKKEKKYLKVIPYFAGGAFLLSVVRYSGAYKKVLDALHISDLWAWFTNAIGKHPTQLQTALIFVYICLAAYLIATYIYYGRKLHNAK